ncbi:MAG: phosphotransferase enzyme family protein [Polyangiales bacterium]
MDGVPAEVLRAFGLTDKRLEPISIGLVNRTFRVFDGDRPVLILQQLHPAFRGEVNLDIEAITAHVARHGVPTPRVVRTLENRAWIDHEDRAWRALTHLPGVTTSKLEDPRLAGEAAKLAARFHAAVDDLEHTFHFTRPGAHDTKAHLSKLERELARAGEHPVRPIAEAILSHRLPELPELPVRIIHGDLKISNILFDTEKTTAVALLDLDTFQHGTIAIELGDALRSWCNPAGEVLEAVRVDRDVFAAAVRGYAETTELEPEESEAIVPGFETIALELSSRFAVDAIEDRYFAWDSTRYPSRVAHNLARAAGQLALARNVAESRRDLSAIVTRAFAR